MNRALEAANNYCAEIARLSADLGRRVTLQAAAVLDRSDAMTLRQPSQISPNGSCRLLPSQQGWLAVNLPRDSDWQLLEAWLGVAASSWDQAAAAIAKGPAASLLETSRLLGLPVSLAGEANGPGIILNSMGEVKRPGRLNVVDISALWAGPLCGSVFAAMGAAVTKIETASRPDPARIQTAFFARLNRNKQELQAEFSAAALKKILREADVLITSARPRAFAQIGLTPAHLFAVNPGLVWVAITGHGWDGAGSDRVGFGDDAAAAGNLVDWNISGRPSFLGDALADPLTGLAAAAAALAAVAQGGGTFIDAAMARVAADAAGLAG